MHMFEHDFECLTMCFLHKAICNTTTLLINFSQSFKRFFFSEAGILKGNGQVYLAVCQF